MAPPPGTARQPDSVPAVRANKLALGDKTFDITHRALVMGILNRTPDSFYDHGATFALDDLVKRGLDPERKRLFVIDGSKALRSAIERNFGEDGLVQRCQETDRPIAALLRDLKQRGLLDSTLVVWGGEFGRTPMNEERNGSKWNVK